MSGLISISSSGGGSNNASPIISNLRVDGKIGVDSFTIKYTVEDFENTILRHYISINGEKKEITKELGYESSNNEFTYTLSGLQQGTNYNVQIEVTDGVETVQSDVISITTSNVQTYGVKVMENNSNPNTSVTYIEGAVGVNPANSTSLGGWANKFPFDKIRIVGFKNGQVTKEIKKDNKAQYTDRSTVPTDVDVMVEIPKVYWKFTNISNGYELRISDTKIEGSDCYAHKVGGVEKDFIYVGAYLGYNQSGKLRSRSGVTPTVSQTLTQFRQQARANGNGYQQMSWFTLMLLQILYLIAYKNLDSQIALGMGYVGGGSLVSTGGTDRFGMCFGNMNQTQQMCFLGIEDLWGNLRQFIDGIEINSSFQVLTVPDNKTFNNDGSGYKNIGKFISSSIDGKVSKVVHTNEGGFLTKEASGSITTYYCDSGALNNNSIGYFGGRWYEKQNAGIFGVNMRLSKSTSASDIGSRLCYLG